MTTAAAAHARKTGQRGPVAGDGPVAQRTVVTATSGQFVGRNGKLNGGTHGYDN